MLMPDCKALVTVPLILNVAAAAAVGLFEQPVIPAIKTTVIAASSIFFRCRLP